MFGGIKKMDSTIRAAFRAALGLFSAPAVVRIHYALHHKRLPNLGRAERFTEMVVQRKLFDRDPRLPLRADKLIVKSFATSRIGTEYITPTLWSGIQLPSYEDLKRMVPFVLKSNNGSATNAFVRSITDIDLNFLRRRASAWLRQGHASWAGEWLYTQITPRLLIEPYLGALERLPVDYKIFVFNRRAEYIEVDTDRAAAHKRTFFDRQWNRQEFSLGYPIDPRPISQPNCLSEMLELAESLAEDIPFVRVDFYEIDGRPRFGEMTFYPDAGIAKFKPDKMDFVFGSLWRR